MATEHRHLCESTRHNRIKNGRKSIKIDINFLFAFILATNVAVVNASETNETIANDIPKQMRIIEAIAGRSFFSDVYQNGTFRTGNSLWDNLLNKCTVKPSVSCLQKNVYSYLDDKLAFDGDIDVGGGVCFKKNSVDVNKYTKEANFIYRSGSSDEEKSLDDENEIDEEDEPETPFEEVTDSLYSKGIKFLVTHDMKMKLPEIFFNGATLKVSPRALTKTGALVHIDIEPRETEGQGRLFFHKIKKYIKRKLLMAALAIILVIKLIALKLIFVLPLILGVTTAKKMFLKLLLFIFPALSHIFKLCSWYHQNYHTTKFHHHHHLITHHHKGPHGPYHHPHHEPTVVVRPHAAGPPHSHPHSHDHYPSNTHEHYPQDWELSGPGLGNEYIASGIHRNAIANFKPDVNDVNDINAWGLGFPPGAGQSMNSGEVANSNVVPTVAQHSGQKYVATNNHNRPVGPPNPYLRNKKTTPKDPAQAEKEALIRAAALAARAPPSPVRDEILRVSTAKLKESNRVKMETDLVKQQLQIIAAQDPETIAAEKFYGQLLEKVDKILTSFGAIERGCRERALCALYRQPFKYAPYSNLVSNELSKDSSELLPPAESKMALRYYIYVQAARDGQEEKDCSTTYPNCDTDYNK